MPPREVPVYEGYIPERAEYASFGLPEDEGENEWIKRDFERMTGEKFNPNIHRIEKRHDASGTVSDDNVYSSYVIYKNVN